MNLRPVFLYSRRLLGIIVLLSIVLPNTGTLGGLIVARAQDEEMGTEAASRAANHDDGHPPGDSAPAGLSPGDWDQIKTLLPQPAAVAPDTQQAYLKASNAEADDRFGYAVAISGDTLVVGAHFENSSASGGQSDNSATEAGAAYVFTRVGSTWSQSAYLKASNAEAYDNFGVSVAISGDTIVVGASYEDSSAGGGQGDNSASDAGAAYVFTQVGGTWSQAAFLKASNAEAVDYFGRSVALSGDTIVVGARGEDSSASGGQSDNSAPSAGAAYVFNRVGGTWSEQAYLKASNAEASDKFGSSLAVSGDTIVVGANEEDSSADGGQSDNSAPFAGAAYVFTRVGSAWSQQALLKASNAETDDQFGFAVATSGDTIVVGAVLEDSSADGGQGDNSALYAGAAYVYTRVGGSWSQGAYLKASNAEFGDLFGNSVAISGDTIVVGAYGEDSSAAGGQSDNSAPSAGAAYVYTRVGSTWSQSAYLNASNAEASDYFGWSAAISGDSIVVGANGEDSSAQGDNSASYAGAAYVFIDPTPTPLNPIGDIIDRSPTYTWSRVSGAANYQFQLRKGSTVIYTKTVGAAVCSTSTCSSTPRSILSFNTIYKWRVRSQVGGVWGSWSTYKTFMIPQLIPVPKTPSGDITDKTPRYVWKVVPGAAAYKFQLRKGTTLIYTKSVSSSACGTSTCSSTPTTTLGYFTYKWRVRAKVGGVWGAWSPYKTFRVRKTRFNSTFNTHKNGWKNVTGTWTIHNSSYLKTLGAANKYASTYYNYDWTKLKYEVRIKRFGCTSCSNGVYLRGTPSPTSTDGGWENGYWFAYSNNGYFSVWEGSSGEYSPLENWTSSAAINKGGWNTLKVLADGSALKFYINGTLVWSGSDATLTAGKVGLDMYKNSSTGNKLFVDWAKLTTNFSMSMMDELVESGGVELEGGSRAVSPDPFP